MFKNQYQLLVMADSLEILNDKDTDQEIKERINKVIRLLKVCNKLVCKASDLLSDEAGQVDINKFDLEMAELKNLL